MRTWVIRPVVFLYNEDIDKAKHARRKAERKWMRMRLHSDFAEYKKKENYVTNQMNISRQESYTQFVEENSSNQKKKHCLIQQRSCSASANMQLRFPEHADKTVLQMIPGGFLYAK